jgi:hypothetical protein
MKALAYKTAVVITTVKNFAEWKWLAVIRTLSYKAAMLITVVKGFIGSSD